jgi:hypothetical protein
VDAGRVRVAGRGGGGGQGTMSDQMLKRDDMDVHWELRWLRAMYQNWMTISDNLLIVDNNESLDLCAFSILLMNYYDLMDFLKVNIVITITRSLSRI